SLPEVGERAGEMEWHEEEEIRTEARFFGAEEFPADAELHPGEGTAARAAPPEEAARREVVPVAAKPEAPAPRPESALADAMGLEEGPALQEVAGRLERIAGALR